MGTVISPDTTPRSSLPPRGNIRPRDIMTREPLVTVSPGTHVHRIAQLLSENTSAPCWSSTADCWSES